MELRCIRIKLHHHKYIKREHGAELDHPIFVRGKKYTWFWTPSPMLNLAAEFELPGKLKQAYVYEFDILRYIICANLFKCQGSCH